MKRQIGAALIGVILGVGGVVCTAEQPAHNPMKAGFEMRRNIAWTAEGLYKLGRTSDRTLKLTKKQAKKILPLYQELIAKKIIRLKPEEGRIGPPPPGMNWPKPGPKHQPPAGQPRPPLPRRHHDPTLVAFGNAKMDAINRILTKKQVEFIDNLDFDSEKYGFPDPAKLREGPPKGNFPGGRPLKMMRPGKEHPDPGRMSFDPKFKAGRKRLARLYQDVLQMLQNMK